MTVELSFLRGAPGGSVPAAKVVKKELITYCSCNGEMMTLEAVAPIALSAVRAGAYLLFHPRLNPSTMFGQYSTTI